MSDLRISTESSGETLLFKLSGSVGIDDVGPLEQEIRLLLEKRPQVVIVDLTQLAFLSSVGMAALVQLHRGLKAQGGVARIVGPSPQVFGVLDRARIIEFMPVFPTTERAIGQV